MGATVVLFTILIVLCTGEDTSATDKSPRLRFYHGSINNYTETLLEKSTDVFFSSWFNPEKETLVYTHGFKGRPSGPAVVAVLSAYLARGADNVVLLDWQGQAAAVKPNNLGSSYLDWAAPNARSLASQLAEHLLELHRLGFDLNKTHFVGHSLGAQIFGITGNYLSAKGVLLPWITGLDPARVDFEGRPAKQKLTAASAAFVDIVHSDPARYGYRRPQGSVDFWPNYSPRGLRQPGCDDGPHAMFSPGDLCNHNRAWQLLVAALAAPGSVLGSHARSYKLWRGFSREQRLAHTLALGRFDVDALPGSYYFTTNSEPPYGLGENGL